MCFITRNANNKITTQASHMQENCDKRKVLSGCIYCSHRRKQVHRRGTYFLLSVYFAQNHGLTSFCDSSTGETVSDFTDLTTQEDGVH